jgi:sugar lactone lactonase YvrE
VEDIIVTGGAMSDFASTSSRVYKAIFTPTLAGATSIKVAANTFTDAAGNNNTTAQFNWTYIVSTISLSINASTIVEGDSATITATLSAATSSQTRVSFDPSGTAELIGDYLVSNMSNEGKVAATIVGGNGPGSAANQFHYPWDVAVDASGNIYIADFDNYRIQKWAPGDTTGTTVAGGNGYGSAANQFATRGVAVDASGNVYIADNGNHRIQKWAPGATEGVTVAGGNGYGSAANQLNNPSGVAVDALGNVYIADAGNHRIQKWAPGDTIGTTVAGGNGQGSAANQFSWLNGVAVDAAGNVYIADANNHRVQKWVPGATEGVTVAGGNGYGSAANQLENPSGVAVDAAGNVYIADTNNDRIQKWAPGASEGTTVAGGNGRGSAANQFHYPYGVAVDASGNVYVADNLNHRIQKVTNGPQIIIPSGQTSAAIIVKAISDGIGERDETIFLTPSATGATLTSSDAISLIINSTPPTMVITSEEGSDGFTSEDSTLSLSFTSNESTIDFSIEDITVTGGVISAFVAISETIYTATFTPLEEGDKTIDVAAGTFKNVVGNGNIAAAQFNWKYDIENSPQLSDVAFTLAENSVNGTSLGILEASDADGDTLTYLIISGNDAEAFSLDSVSGALTVSTSSALDFETTPAFNLAIRVSDGALSDSAIVTINLTDVEENVAPTITAATYSLAENSPNGTVLGTVEATDPDGDTLTYVIVNGNDAEAFSLDSESGELIVSTSSALDFETTPTYSLGIEVSDGALSDLAIFTINLTDVEEEEETLSLADASAMIYPNPSNGIVNIKMAAFKEATIYNLSGKRIMRSTDNRIDVSALSEGVYIIKLENRGGDRFSTRLIKE